MTVPTVELMKHIVDIALKEILAGGKVRDNNNNF